MSLIGFRTLTLGSFVLFLFSFVLFIFNFTLDCFSLHDTTLFFFSLSISESSFNIFFNSFKKTLFFSIQVILMYLFSRHRKQSLGWEGWFPSLRKQGRRLDYTTENICNIILIPSPERIGIMGTVGSKTSSNLGSTFPLYAWPCWLAHRLDSAVRILK